MRRASELTRQLVLLIGFGILAGLASGCWDDAEQINEAVWSDDDQRQAFVKLLFEESGNTSPLSGTTNKRNFRHRIYLQQSDGSFRALTGERANQHGNHFYYMRSAGYVLIEVIESGQTTRFDVIRTATGVSTTLASFTRPDGPAIPCMHIEALPSPDGSVIAIIERSPEGGGGTPAACASGDTTVTFVDAASLSTISERSWPMSAMPEAIWDDGGNLYIWGYLDGSWALTPSGGWLDVERPSCTWPRTSSSPLSSSGVMIGPGSNDSNPVVVVSSGNVNCRVD